MLVWLCTLTCVVVYAYMCGCLCACACACIRVCVCSCACVRVRVCACIYVHVRVCLCGSLCLALCISRIAPSVLIIVVISFRLMPAKGEDWLSPWGQSHVLHGPVVISHTGTCDLLNKPDPHRKRIVISTPECRLPSNVTVAYSLEDCKRLLGARCHQQAVREHWDANASLIRPVSFLRPH